MHARFRIRAEFFGHLAAWFLIAIVGGMIAGVYADGSTWRILAILWTTGLFVHASNTIMEEQREKAIDRELERYGLRPRAELESEKAKRDALADARLVALSGDGELVDYDEDNMPRHQSANG